MAATRGDERKNLGLDELANQPAPPPLTVSPELSQLLLKTTELAARSSKTAAAAGMGEEQEEEQTTTTNAADCSRRRRSGSGQQGGGGAAAGTSLRLRRLPSSRCPSCSGAPFTDASFRDYFYSNGGDGDDKNTKSELPTTKQTALEASKLWLLENGRSLSAPLLALLVAAASVAWSLYEYAGSSAAALGGPALYLAKACVATSQACYGMVFLPVSRGLVTTLRATPLRRFFDFDRAIQYHIALAIIGAVAGTLHGVFVTAAALTWTQRPGDEQVALGSPKPLSLGDIASTRAFVTGWVLVLLIVVAYPFATGWPKRSPRLRGTKFGVALNSFTNFWITHHLLIIVFPLVLIAHCVGIPTSELLSEERSAQLLLRKANKMLLLLLPPLGIYALERIIRMWRSTRPTPVLSARLYPASSSSGVSRNGEGSNGDGSSSSNNSNGGCGGGILELRVQKPRGFRFTSGQYIHLCCPAISSFEWHPFTLASAPQDPFLMIVIKDVGDWTHALHELVREKGEARDGRLLLPSSLFMASKANAAATGKPAAASPTSFSVVASPRGDAAALPDRAAFEGSRDLESQLSAAAADAAAGGGLPPLPPPGASSSLALARGSSLSAPLPLLAAALGEKHHPPLTKRVSFAEEKVAALVVEEEETKGKGGDVGKSEQQRPASIPPLSAAPVRTSMGRGRRRTRDSDIPYTFSIDGPWGAPTQEFADYDVVVLLGAGIGVTPMASVLRSLAHELAHARCPNCACVNEALVSERIRQSRVFFHWILPDNEGVQWFSDVLYGIAAADTLGIFDLNLHFTRVDGGSRGEKRNGGATREEREAANNAAATAAEASGNKKSGVAIHNGRPDFDLILGRVKAAHPDEHIGVFFCGPGGLSSGIRETCRSLNRRTTTTGGEGGGGQASEDGGSGSASGRASAAFASESGGCSARSSSGRRSGFGGGGEISFFEEVFCKNEAATTTKAAARKNK